MSLLSKNSRQTTLYYNSESNLGRKVYAAAKATDAQLFARDLSQTKISGMEWAKVIGLLQMKVMDLIDQEHPVFRGVYGDKKVDLEERDALLILENHPEVLVFPIAIRGEKAILVKQTNDMHKLVNPDTGGIPQSETDL